MKQAGFTVKNCLVVEKGTIGGIGDLTGSYANNAEWIIFCQKGRRTFQHTTLLENRKKKGCSTMQAGSEVKNIRHALMPVGLAKNIRKRPIIPYGRNSIRFIIQR